MESSRSGNRGEVGAAIFDLIGKKADPSPGELAIAAYGADTPKNRNKARIGVAGYVRRGKLKPLKSGGWSVV